jgi:hypothetical protein
MELQLPQRRKPGSHAFNTNREAVRTWIDDLPLVNTVKSLQLTAEALEETNQLDLPVQNRLEVLELFITPVMCVSSALKKLYLTKPVPLEDIDLGRATSVLELYNQMATGYRILVSDLDAPGTPDPIRATAIHRALRYLCEMLLNNYQIYIQYPDGLWKTIHSLYAQAEQHGITSRPITDTTLPDTGHSSIETAYKQILLLSLACPYRLQQNEMHHVYNALVEWVGASHLYHANDAGERGLFATNLQSDEPPIYSALREGKMTEGQWRILDTADMANQMRAVLSEQAAATSSRFGTDNSGTMQRLMLTWGVMPKRKYSRYKRDAHIRLVVGLDSIHRTVADPVNEPPENDSARDETIDDKRYLQDPTFERETSFNANSPADKQHKFTDNLLQGAYSTSNQAERSIEHWKMCDMSAGGYCLLWDSESASSARVGELIALTVEEENNLGNWQLGVIRWMKSTEEHGLELGIQMLSPGARAISAHVCKGDINTGDTLQGILLPEIKALKQQATLLLPSLPFRTGCSSTIVDAGKTQQVQLTRQLENTGSFSQYHYKPE